MERLLLDDLHNGHVDESLVERLDVERAAGERRVQRDVRDVDEVRAFAAEARVRLVAQDEHDVGGHSVGPLVPLALERDGRPGRPAGLHLHCEDLVAHRTRVSVFVHHAARDLHFLDAAEEHLFERDVQLLFDRRVLLLLAATRETAEPH